MPHSDDPDAQTNMSVMDSVAMEVSSLSESNLGSISSQDLEQITGFQSQLESMDTEEEVETLEQNVKLESQDDVFIDSNIVEVEIETESDSATEVRQEPKANTTTLKAIAPKPLITSPKLATKANVISAGGQQIVLIQSPGGTANAVSLTTGQPLKLVSQTGQPITLPQLQAVRQQGIKTSDKNVIFRTTTPKVTTASIVKTPTATLKRVIPARQQKKFIISGNQTGDSPSQLIKVVSSTSSPVITSPTKTISLAQAQEMGLLTAAQIQQLIPQAQGKQIIVQSKVPSKTQVIKATAAQFLKSPTKILPAPKAIQKPGQQKVYIRQGNQLKTVSTSGQQLLRISANQIQTAAGQIHQINIPGQGIQYVRLVSATTSTTSSTAAVTTTASNSTVRTVSSQTTTTTTSPVQTTQPAKVQTIVPVALGNRSTTAVTSSPSMVKLVAGQSVRPVVPKLGTATTAQRILVPASSASVQSKILPGQTITTIPASALNQLQGTIIPNNNNILMVPTQYVQVQSQGNSTPKLSAKSISVTSKISKVHSPIVIPKQEYILPNDSPPESLHSVITNRSNIEPNGLRPRKPCNCTKSQCLKLYCDCFANGEFCHMCNCVNCFNNLDNEEERQRAIRSCLERNPNAFRPKIGKGRDTGDNSVRKHTKGCNCKRSGCLKNYCECYEAKIACSSNCKCVGCRNIEDTMEKKTLRPLAPLISLSDSPNSSLGQHGIISTIMSGKKVAIPSLSQQKNKFFQSDITDFRPKLGDTMNKQAMAFMTQEVIEATCHCLLAQADEAEKNMVSDEQAERQVLEEFGRCLVQIIHCSQTETT